LLEEKTMTRTTTRARLQRHAQPAQHIYIPHSSWTRADHKVAAATPAPIAADDFWARLGL
jgi:hypothetical protein